MSNTNDLSKELAYMVSNTDFCKMLGESATEKVIKYSDLEKYNDINQVIPESKGYRIILVETKNSTGHYCCLLKYNDRIFEWYDSYGMKPDQEFEFISPKMQEILDEKIHILSFMLNKLKKEGGNYFYNKVKFQEMRPNINTCGRWCCFRIFCFMKHNMDLGHFQTFMETAKNKYQLPYDVLVCKFTVALN